MVQSKLRREHLSGTKGSREEKGKVFFLWQKSAETLSKLQGVALLMVVLFLLRTTPWGDFCREKLAQICFWWKSSSPHQPSLQTKTLVLQQQIQVLQEKNRRLQRLHTQISQILPLVPLQWKLTPTIWQATISTPYHRKRFWVEGGRNVSFQKNFGVLWGRQVIGKIAKVYNQYSVVRSIWEPGFRLAVRNSRTRQKYLWLSKGPKRGVLKFVPYDHSICKGDVLITTGEGGSFPPGFLVGKVTQIQDRKKGVLLDIQVQPFAPEKEIEEVFVVVPPK